MMFVSHSFIDEVTLWLKTASAAEVWAFFFLLRTCSCATSPGGCERSIKVGPPAAGQTRRPGAHVHQHQQWPVQPQRSLHSGRPSRQLL